MSAETGQSVGQTTTSSSGNDGSSHRSNPLAQYKSYKENEKALHRKHRGLMQWKPMRNMQFAKDETKYAVRRTFKMGALKGREPGVQSEIGG